MQIDGATLGDGLGRAGGADIAVSDGDAAWATPDDTIVDGELGTAA